MAMIKCPECGQRVSSMALTCPHCGVGIKGHLRECPMCGEWLLDDQTRCPECNSLVEMKPQSDQDSTSGYDKNNQDNKDKQNSKKKKNSNTVIWVLVFLLLLIGIGIAWAIQAYSDHQDQEEKRRLFEEEMKERRLEEEKRNKEFAEIQRKDSLDWVYAQEVNTVASMDRYLQLHPSGNYMDEAMMKREDLKRTEVTEEDRARIRNILESRLTEAAATRKPSVGDIIGIHYQISGDLSITKEQTPTGSVQFYAKCKVSETISRTDPTKPTDSTFVLRAILDIDKNVMEINL